MYRKHWKLTRKPFTTAYEPELIFFREPFAEAYHTLTLAARLAPANLRVLGEKGTGKTTLLRKLEEALGDEMRVIMLAGKYLNERSTLLDALEKTGAFVASSPGLSIEARLTEHFRDPGSGTSAAVIVVDDVDMVKNPETLNDLNSLQESGVANDWPLVTIFSGREIPDQLQSGKSIRLSEVNLPLPTRNECGVIIEHRLAASGSTATIFTPSALERLITRSNGDIYTLLTMADLCLQIGSVDKVHIIDDELVKNRVEPFLQRFFQEAGELRETAAKSIDPEVQKRSEEPQNAERTLVTANAAPAQSADVATSGVSPLTMGPQRLVSQAELETYRASSVSEQQRNNIQRLTKKIARGELDVTESLGKPEEKTAGEIDGATEQEAETKTDSVETLDFEELYQAGIATLNQILGSLRNKQFTDLKPLKHLATAIINSVANSSALLRATINQEDSSELHTHLMNVGVLSAVVAKELNIDEERRPELIQIAMVHDVGHLHCGEELLLSENRFDRKDFKAIKQHPIVGRDLIRKYTNGSELMADVIAQEHERDDGLGYPNYLDASDIHLYAKIIAVCDVFEALSHSRAHRRALTPEEAIVNMNATMARRTDPRIVRALHRAVLIALAG